MISYRHHVVSLVAVFLALAIGVVLGGGPLADLGRAAGGTAATTTDRRLADAQRAAAFGDDFAVKVAPSLYGGRLAERPVAVLTLPGADDEVVTALTDQVGAAGGEVVGRYDALAGLLDPGERALVDTLGSQLMTQLPDGAVDRDASTYVRMGQLLATALATTDEDGEAAERDATSVRESLAGADLLTAAQEDAPRASLVLVVTGGRVDADVLAGLLTGLGQGATGVVVTGDRSSARGAGVLSALRREGVSDEVSTVDGVESPLGQVTAVLALVRELSGTGGAFGASGAEGAVPLG